MPGTIVTTDPATGTELARYNLLTDRQLEKCLGLAQHAFNSWRRTSMAVRAELLRNAAVMLREHAQEFSRIITFEMGKTRTSAQAEVEKCAWVCEYYAENAEDLLAPRRVVTDARDSYVCYQPMGPILAVMPWNFPFWQVFRFCAPTLMAGNVGILKHASNVPGCALLIEEILTDAGFPEGVFQTLLVESNKVEEILRHPSVCGVSLTGSGPAGSAVAKVAGSALKPSLLELGGSDPYLILADADLDLAADQCTRARILNAGQSCIGAKRFIVDATIFDDFLRKFKAQMKAVTWGDPSTEVDMGPMARLDLRDELHTQVMDSVALGAVIELGGYIPERAGSFYPPTILTHVQSGMPAYDEELFGPVASVIKVSNEKEAIRVANDSPFGLGACVFTKDWERGKQIAETQLQAGCCFVNQFVKSDPRLPFGGIKDSGYGRELGAEGIRAFVNVKTVYVQ